MRLRVRVKARVAVGAKTDVQLYTCSYIAGCPFVYVRLHLFSGTVKTIIMGQVESTSAREVEDACMEDCKVCTIMKEDIKKLEGSLERREEKLKRTEEENRRMLKDKDVQLKSTDRRRREIKSSKRTSRMPVM